MKTEYASTQRKLSEETGYSEVAISKLMNHPQMTRPFPEKYNNGWNIKEVKLWIKEQHEEAQKRVGRGNGTWTALHDARLDLLKLTAEQQRMKVARDKKALIPAEEVQVGVSRLCIEVRMAVESIPDKVSHVTKNPKICKAVKSCCEKILLDLSVRVRDLGGNPSSG